MSPERTVELCTRKLAQLLFNHRSYHGEHGTPEGDWLAAEAWLRAHPEVMMSVLFSTWPDHFTDLDFEHTYGELIYERAFVFMVRKEDPVYWIEGSLAQRREIADYLRECMPRFMGVEAATA